MGPAPESKTMKSIISSVFLALAVVLCFSFASVQAQGGQDCAMCQLTVMYVEGYLQQNYTQTQIVKQLEVVCALAPDTFRDQCDSFVEYYVPVVIAYIVKTEDPKTACTQLASAPPSLPPPPAAPSSCCPHS